MVLSSYISSFPLHSKHFWDPLLAFSLALIERYLVYTSVFFLCSPWISFPASSAPPFRICSLCISVFIIVFCFHCIMHAFPTGFTLGFVLCSWCTHYAPTPPLHIAFSLTVWFPDVLYAPLFLLLHWFSRAFPADVAAYSPQCLFLRHNSRSLVHILSCVYIHSLSLLSIPMYVTLCVST